MDITTIAYLESLMASLQTGLANMKAGSTMERGYMLEKLGAMRRILQPESGRADKLRALIWNYENAVRNSAYAWGFRDGRNKTAGTGFDPKQAIIEWDEKAAEAEQELYNYIETMEN